MAVRERGFETSRKGDDTPVTEADVAAERIILGGLRAAMAEGVLPEQPIVAEEAASRGEAMRAGEAFILVDPLDGTREFVRGGEDFTVNIAFIELGVPVAGVVFVPALDTLYAGGDGVAWRERDGTRVRLRPSAAMPERPRVVASRSHRTERTDRWVERLAGAGGCDTVSIGSSLKFCLLAEGMADYYPRFGRTMEWDTAAGDAVLRAAGGATFTCDGAPLSYGRRAGGPDVGRPAPDVAFANPDFIATRSGRFVHVDLE